MSGRRGAFIPRTTWTAEELEAHRQEAIVLFRHERMSEPLKEYLLHFEEAQGILDELTAITKDFAALEEQAVVILSRPGLLEGLRYLAGPPISEDDLETLIDSSLSARALKNDPGLGQRVSDTITAGLDQRRFPWVIEEREPTREERHAAVIATAALMAHRRTQTGRRNDSKAKQEQRVKQALLDQGFVEDIVPGGSISTLSEAPQPGQFTREVHFGSRKADIVVGLWDKRYMPIECKVSNSSANSVKRLNNDAAIKAKLWISEFGERLVVPVATLTGVFNLVNLEQAQGNGLTLYWAHRLSELTDWIERTRQS